MENRPFEDVFPIENGDFPLLGNHCGSDIFMSEISCYSGCSESEALLGNLLCRRNQVPWPNEWHDEKNMMRYGGNHQWWKEKVDSGLKDGHFFCIHVRFLGFKNKAWMGRTQVFRLLKRELHTNHLNNTNLVSFLRIPWQKKTSFFHLTHTSSWLSLICDQRIHCEFVSMEECSHNLHCCRVQRCLEMSRLLWNKALATPNHQWYVALPTRVPFQPPRFYHEAGKVNFVDPPAMASAVVSRGLGILAPSSQAMLGRFAWCTTPVQKFNYG